MVAIFVTRKESLQKPISATTLFLWAVYTGNAPLAFGGCLQPRPPGCIEGSQPFDYISAGGDMRVAEERLKAASYIGFRP